MSWTDDAAGHHTDSYSEQIPEFAAKQSYDGRESGASDVPAPQPLGPYEPRIYSAGDVIAGWKRWEDRGVVRRSKPKGKPQAKTAPAYINVDLLQWLHLESFFTATRPAFDEERVWLRTLRHDKSGRTDMASPHFLEEFYAWYEKHPLTAVYTGDPDRKPVIEFQPMPIAEAVEVWNSRARRKKKQRPLDPIERKQITLRAALDASNPKKCGEFLMPPKLTTWSPDGRKHTTLNDIREWLETDERRISTKK